MATNQAFSVAGYASAFRKIIGGLSPTTLAAISVEMEAMDNDYRSGMFLDYVNTCLVNNVGEDEAEQLRTWVRENV